MPRKSCAWYCISQITHITHAGENSDLPETLALSRCTKEVLLQRATRSVRSGCGCGVRWAARLLNCHRLSLRH